MSAPAPLVPLSGPALALTAAAVSLASFMAVVDITIANVSIPTISGNLGVSPEVGEWAITFFAIANSICIPLTGWLSRRLGQVRLFAGAVAAFTVASVLCGLAPNFEMLLACRVLQGMVAGPIVPLSQALLVAVFPPTRRPLAVSIWAMTNMAGPVAGPLLGGWLTDDYSWPWIFLVNAPVGVFVVMASLRMLRGRDTPRVRLPVDLVGLALLALAIGCLQLTLDRGRILDWFASPVIVATSALSAAAFAGLIVWELRQPHPIVDLQLFKRRNFWIGTLAVAIGFGLYFAALVLLPLWLQTDMGYTATWAGLVTAPMGVFGILLAPLLGRWVQKHDARVYATAAFVAWALVAWWRAGWTTSVTAQTVALTCLAQGIGIGLFLTPLVTLSLAGLPADKVAAASGLQTAVRMMCGSLMASLAATFWDERARLYQNHMADALAVGRPGLGLSLDALMQAGMDRGQALAVLWRQLQVQADMLALNDFFLYSSVAFAASGALVWLARHPRQAA